MWGIFFFSIIILAMFEFEKIVFSLYIIFSTIKR